MLGFVITGVVVNNAILMIEQTMLHLRDEGLTANEAIVKQREIVSVQFSCQRLRRYSGWCRW